MKYLLLLLLLTGCSPLIHAPVELDTDKYIHSYDLREIFNDVVISDEVYVCPTKKTLLWIHAGYVRRARALGVIRWLRRDDCDKKTKRYIAYAQEVFAKQSRFDSAAESMAIGTYYYTRGADGVGHAIVVALTADGSMVWLDPQTIPGKVILLSEGEQASTYHQGF